jgi:hypothetical protein
MKTWLLISSVVGASDPMLYTFSSPIYTPQIIIQASNYDDLTKHGSNCTMRMSEPNYMQNYLITACNDGWTAIDFTSNLYNSADSRQSAKMTLQTSNGKKAQSIYNFNKYYSYIDSGRSDELRVYTWRSDAQVF